MKRPSGDHVGLQSVAASLNTGVGSPPWAGIVMMSIWALVPSRVWKTMRWPWGDQRGMTPSPEPSRRASPPSTGTTHSSLTPSQFSGMRPTRSVAYASIVPSGDQEGLKPSRVTLLTASPVRPITKMPPPSRLDLNAILCPSGENAGWSSSSVEPSVRQMGILPLVLCR